MPYLTGQFNRKFSGLDSKVSTELESLLAAVEVQMLDSKSKGMADDHYRLKMRRAIDHLLHNVIIGEDNKLYFRLEARELDFTLGENVYSTTPRLLLKVPSLRRSNATPGPVTVQPVGGQVPDAAPPAMTDQVVLIVPNHEGAQALLCNRPVVQYSALAPGEYVIVGGLQLSDRKDIYDAVAAVTGASENENAFHVFDQKGTVEDLAEIIRRIHKLNFGNMYNTSEKYRTNTVQPLPATENHAVEKGYSGFYEKPANAVLSSAVFLPGPVVFIGRGRSEEVLPENGYALYEKVLGDEQYDIKPISPSYMQNNFVYRDNRETVPIKAPALTAQVMFIPDHPLRDFMREFSSFQEGLSAINKKITPKPSADGSDIKFSAA